MAKAYVVKGDDDTLDVYRVGEGQFSSWAVDNGHGNQLSAGMTEDQAKALAMRHAGGNAECREVK